MDGQSRRVPNTGNARSVPGLKTRVRGEERRREILQTAMRVFAEGGFNSVSLADIASEVGITPAGILHYFPSKAALLMAVLHEREAQNAAAQQTRRDSGATLVGSFVGMLADNDRRPDLVKLFVVLAAEASAVEHPGHEYFKHRNDDVLPDIAEELRGVIDETRLPDGVSAETVARWLLALAHGLGAQWVFDTSSFDRAGHVALFVNMLAPYLKEGNDVKLISERSVHQRPV